MDFSEIKLRLLKLDTTCVSDANKQLRVMQAELRPVRLGLKMIGQAHTVKCRDDFLTVIKGLHDAVSGEVLVVDTCGSRVAVAGELFTTEAVRRGLAGIVIDGACRDTAKIRTLCMPVYSRSVLPLSGAKNRIFETQIPVACGGVTVHPGDVLFGDDDGIVVASLEELTEAIPVAEDIQAKEEIILKKMAAGHSLLDLLNFDEHLRNVQSGKESALHFKV